MSRYLDALLGRLHTRRNKYVSGGRSLLQGSQKIQIQVAAGAIHVTKLHDIGIITATGGITCDRNAE